MTTKTPPRLLLTDSYKATHSLMYPPCREMHAYLTCRGHLPGTTDQRIVVAGTRYLQELLNERITMNDIHAADEYFNHHGVAGSSYPWPRDLWVDVVKNNGGRLPFYVTAMREGSVIYPQVPVLTITASDQYARLVTWMETILMHIWSPITTATKSAHAKSHLSELFKRTVDDDMQFLLNSRLHDFGFRGASSIETAMTTGYGHLLSFDGTDTLAAGWLASQYNGGPVGESVIASEHSVMTSWPSEIEAVRHLISITPNGGILSCVADTYDYNNFLYNILPQIAPLAKAKGILFVVRPDSGNPWECVQQGLIACRKAFGSSVNKKGYEVLNGAAVIQGDGIELEQLIQISNRVADFGFSAQCVAYGMGGGLLQKQNRDTLKVAMKLSQITDMNGTVRDVFKHPSTDRSKWSLPGKFNVTYMDSDRGPIVYPEESPFSSGTVMEPLYDGSGYTTITPSSFYTARLRLQRQWELTFPQKQVLHPSMIEKQLRLL